MSQTIKYDIKDLKPLIDNPRLIDRQKFNVLLDSLSGFKQMHEMRPLLIDEEMNILCGNMRFKAFTELGYENVYAKVVRLSEEKKKELVIKDNLSYGEWDEQELEQNWDKSIVDDWLGKESFDYSTLDYEDLADELSVFTGNVKRAIQLKFNHSFEEAKELERSARGKDIYIGGLLIEAIKRLKDASN
jgi:ParB-like chromosome segregation protein Spo0J